MSEQYFFKLKKKDKYKSVVARPTLKDAPTTTMKTTPATSSQTKVAEPYKVGSNPNSANTTTLSSLKIEEEATANNLNSELTTEILNSTYVKNNEFLTRLINTFAIRVNNYNQEGELFNPEHNRCLLSNTKMLAELIKIQTETLLAKTTLQKSNNTINNTINYKDVMNVLHKRK
ncbi:hypothetical protein HAV_00530 [Candidatus Hepatincola sp. Av]